MVNELLPAYGEAFLRYVLAADNAVTDLASLAPTHQQQEVCAVLRQLALTAPIDPHGMGRLTQLGNLGRWQAETGSSIANALRAHAGGSLPDVPESDDPLVASLLHIARDIWPTLLLPPPTHGPATFWMSLPVGLFDHPATLDAAQAFLSDHKLRRLFPSAPTGSALDGLDRNGLFAVGNAYWISTSGRGGSQQLIGLLAGLITNARLTVLAETGDDTWDGLIQTIPKVIAVLRKLATGKIVNVVRLIGFRGLEIPEGTIISLPHGQIRAPRPQDQSFLLPESENVSAIFVTTFPLQLKGIRVWQSDETPAADDWKGVRINYQAAQHEIDATRLAVLLASPGSEFWAMSEQTSLIVDPTVPGGVSQWAGQKYGARQGKVDDKGCDRISEWWRTVHRVHPRELDIAMRRVLSAAGDRIDPIDGFVDAVVAWENCFGTETETTFRVTAAIAALLEPESEQARISRQKALKSMYGKRSRVVHGAIQPEPDESVTLRDEALKIAVECLRRLYQCRTDLLPMKSESRSTHLVLGANTDGITPHR
jgi:hypothetical protein